MSDLRVTFPQPCDEPWDAMATTAGCDRVCGRCDRVIHDLAHYDVDEAEALLRANPRTCVRAEIGADGAIALKPGRGGKARRMVVAAAAAAGLLAVPAPLLAQQPRGTGVIAGDTSAYGIRVRVTATGPDGRRYRTRARSDGRFRIRNLPAGTYRLYVESICGIDRTVENVVVRDGETQEPNLRTDEMCVVVGQLRIEESRG